VGNPGAGNVAKNSAGSITILFLALNSLERETLMIRAALGNLDTNNLTTALVDIIATVHLDFRF
jgi:hypothetical protein